jgi:uncharacterized membrane protein YfcA
MSVFNLAIAALAAVFAGIVNAVAGGGTLITFPILTALGLPVVVANITNTVALCPGYLSGTLAQRNDLKGQRRRLWILIPISLIGGGLWGGLLIYTGDKNFRTIVPYLILLASFLIALQNQVKAWIVKRGIINKEENLLKSPLIFLVLLASVYGGYFGAGVSVIVLAALALIYNDSIVRLNALKQAIAFSINVSAAVYFCFSGKVSWITALVMAVGAIIGGGIGGKLSSKVKPQILRWTVVVIGVIVALYYFLF